MYDILLLTTLVDPVKFCFQHLKDVQYFAFDQSFASTATKYRMKNVAWERRFKASPTFYLLDINAKVMTQLEVWRSCDNHPLIMVLVLDEDGSCFRHRRSQEIFLSYEKYRTSLWCWKHSFRYGTEIGIFGLFSGGSADFRVNSKGVICLNVIMKGLCFLHRLILGQNYWKWGEGFWREGGGLSWPNG